MNINPNGFVANVVFRAKGERKPMGICTLLPKFLWQLTQMILLSGLVLFGRIIFVIPMLCDGYRPVFNWIIPEPWARGPTPWSVPYRTPEQKKKDEARAHELNKWIMGFTALFVVGILLWLIAIILGTIAVYFTGLESSSIATRFGSYSEASNTIHGLMVMAGLLAAFLAASLLKRWGQNEFSRLLVGYFKAKKDKVCPVVTFE
jgi:hypothetical protein